MTEIVSVPRYVAEGEKFPVINFVEEKEISGQEILYLIFHSDDGDGTFEYENNNDIDPPAEDENGENNYAIFCDWWFILVLESGNIVLSYMY